MDPLSVPQKMLETDAFSQWLKVEILDIDRGYCKLKMRVRKEMLNGFKIAHGGISFSFADSAFAFASNTYGVQCVSIDTSINHYEMLRENAVITAQCTEEALKNKFGFYRVEICEQDKLVALFKGIVARTDRRWTADDFRS